ncbi:MAG: succinate dehydrogenase, partial [Pseudomonadota bacterium]
MASFLTDRKRALGLGSSRSGTHHHWEMMVSSMLIGLMIPAFLITFAIGFNRPYDDVAAFFGQPIPALIMAGSLIVIVRHLMAETIVAVEDYVHGVAGKLTQVAVKSISYTLIA